MGSHDLPIHSKPLKAIRKEIKAKEQNLQLYNASLAHKGDGEGGRGKSDCLSRLSAYDFL